MKTFAAAALALGLAALAGSATAQQLAPTRSFDAVFSVIGRGLNVGDFNYHFQQTGNSYQATATRTMTGWVGGALNHSQDYRYAVRGVVAADGSLRPSNYEHQGGRRSQDRPQGKLIRAVFTENDVVTTATPGRANMGDPPATPDQRRGVIDQITAIAALVIADGDPCARTLHVYMDGRARFDFAMRPNGAVNINSSAYRGPGIRCTVAFRPIAGFADHQDPATLSFLFSNPGPGGMRAPITIEMPTDGFGVVRLEARRVTINGTRLR